jgi:hypothetical protein
MSANYWARNPCKPGEPGLYGRDGRDASKVNLVDAEWTSASGANVPVSTGVGSPPSPGRDAQVGTITDLELGAALGPGPADANAPFERSTGFVCRRAAASRHLS